MKPSNDKVISSDSIYKLLKDSEVVSPLKKTDIEVEKALSEFLKENPNSRYNSIYQVLKNENIIDYSYPTFCRKFRHLFKNAKIKFRKENNKKGLLDKNNVTNTKQKDNDGFVIPDIDYD